MGRIYITLYLWLLFTNTIFAQFSDDFTDGDFSSNPTWAGDDAKFEIDRFGKLHLSAPTVTDHAYLSIPSQAIEDAVWEFYVEIGENPSNTNFTNIYLVADQADLSGTLNGYFVKVGGTTDEVSLFRQDGNVVAEIIDGLDDRVNVKPVLLRVKVIRDAAGNWELLSDNSGGISYVSEGTTVDNTHRHAGFFGVYCEYTSTRSDKFYFDDFTVTGHPFTDDEAPQALSLEVLSADSLRIEFSEALDTASVENNTHYDVEGMNPSLAVLEENNHVLLKFSTPFVNGSTHMLTLTQVADTSGNIISPIELAFTYFEAVPAAFRDIVINEILPDPNPQVDSLPAESDAEFIELYNNSEHPFDLESWRFNDVSLPSFLLLPNQYVILCKNTYQSAYTAYGNAIGLTLWPGLSNSGATLLLKDPDGKSIDSLVYTTSQITGGYSLEQQHPNSPCLSSGNFTISTHTNGATPGRQNATFDDSPDTVQPNLVSIIVDTVNSLTLLFDERLDEASRNNLQNYTLNGGMEVASLQAENLQIKLVLTKNLVQGQSYTVSVGGVTDCSGNMLNNTQLSFLYDMQPPKIVQIIVLDTNKIEVVWDEVIAKASAEKEENYTLNQNINHPASALWDESHPQSAILTFNTAFIHETSYQLSVTNLSDILGYTISDSLPATFSFTYKNQIDSVVVIDGNLLEIYFSEPVNEASAEIIGNYTVDKNVGQAGVAILSEDQRMVTLIFGRNFSENKVQVLTVRNILNTSNVLLSTPVQQFMYDTQSPKITDIIVLSGNSLIISFDEKINRNSAGKTIHYQVARLGNPTVVQLQEVGHTVLLTFPVNFTEEIIYQLSVTGIADLKGNIITRAQTGTFIFDQHPPSITKLIIVSSQQIRLVFSEPLHRNTAQNIGFYQIDQNIGKPDTVILSEAHPDWIDLIFNNTFQDELTYALTVHGLLDGAGNEMVNPITVIFSNQFPSLAEIIPLSETEVRLRFSKKISQETAENPDNYLLNDALKPATIMFNPEDPSEVRLVFAKSFVQKKECLLTVKNISDNQGNTVETLQGVFSYDTKVKSIRMSGNAALQIDFTVPLHILNASNILNFEVDQGVGNPTAAVLNENTFTQLTLYFSQNFVPNIVYQLSILNQIDTLGQLIPASTHQIGTGEKPGFNALLITEIMADPTPPLGLPEVDYLEIYNSTEKVLQLQGIQLSDATTTTYLPNALLPPGEYAIMCASGEVDDFSASGKTIGISNFPSLNNAEDEISLHNEDGELIFSVKYSDNWYKDHQKAQGGWSLEMVDTTHPCGGDENWTASEDGRGGTPGKENSVKTSQPDLMGPHLVNALAISDALIQLTFNEKLKPSSILSGNCSLTPHILIDTVETGNNLSQVRIQLKEKLLPKTAYTVRVANMSDCNGNLIRSENNAFTFYLPEVSDNLDILLNEVLFAPRSGGKKFVELYNYSDKHIDLKNWRLANIANDTISNLKPITTENFIMAPGDFLVLTEDATILQADYPQTKADRVFEVAALPSYPVAEGAVVIINARDEVVQIFEYAEDLHFPLLKETKGVSLERISWEGNVNDSNNWHSAAASAGYATPGLMNSQYRKYEEVSAQFEVEPKVFLPDQSGQADFTSIRYQFDAPGNVATIGIFDAAGRKVKDLLQNATLSTHDAIQWDGTDNHHQKVKTGYYLIYIEVFNLNGERQIFKEKVVVAGRF